MDLSSHSDTGFATGGAGMGAFNCVSGFCGPSPVIEPVGTVAKPALIVLNGSVGAGALGIEYSCPPIIKPVALGSDANAACAALVGSVYPIAWNKLPVLVAFATSTSVGLAGFIV